MSRHAITPWVRAVAWLALASSPVVLALAAVYSQRRFAWAGVALAVYGLFILLRVRRPAGDPAMTTDPA